MTINKPVYKVRNGLLLLSMLFVVACKVTQPYRSPVVDTQHLYRDQQAADTTSMATLHWNELFTDTLLQQLIQKGISNSIDLRIAYSRVRQAQAVYQQSRLLVYPAINPGAGVTVAGYSSTLNNSVRTTASPQFQASFSATWEADIWGKLTSTRRASLAAALAETDNAHAIQTALVAGIATCYYELLALDEQLSITERTVNSRQATVDVMKELKKADVVTSAAVVQSEASRYAAEVTIPDIKRAIRETENQLNGLLGNPPGPVKRSVWNNQPVAALLNTGVPAQLLANRPDVQAAEHNFRHYFELTNVARAYFYPMLSLTASGGYLTVHNLFSPGSWISNLAAGLTQPLYNQGINNARWQAAREQQEQALLGFEKTLLTAGQEVSDALYAYQMATAKITTRNKELTDLERSVSYTQELVKYGFANYTEVLTAQQNLLSARLDQVADYLQGVQAIVQLYRSLGGGWQ
jgi:NodT family efflux transporter outer membrane factor (OMF) lipoprotein